MARYLLAAALVLAACQAPNGEQVPQLTEQEIADTAYHHLRDHLDLMMAGRVEEALE